jgi:SAM-dependent methyltransferase
MIRATLFHESRHLRDDELGSIEPTCRLCGFRGIRTEVFAIQSAPDVTLLHCPSCHASSASRMPTDAALASYYAQYYRAGQEQFTFSGAARFGRHLARAFTPAIGSTGAVRVLDFGGGDGSIAAAFVAAVRPDSTHACRVVVVDPGGVSRQGTIGGVAIEHVATLEQAGGGYDVVIASAILEHIPDAGQTLGALLAQLRPGGALYARTPWSLPLARRLGRYDLGFPGHVHDLGGDYWQSAAGQHAKDVRVMLSRPSIVENTLRDAPLRAAAAHLLKLPAHLEMTIRPRPAVPRWRYVGGWEVVWQRRSP